MAKHIKEIQEEQIEDTILEVWRSENPKSEDIN